MTRSLLVVLALLAIGCGPVHKPPATPVPPARTDWYAAVDWEAAGAEAVSVLAGYVQTDTRNPPGGETAGAEYLARILQAEGIDSQIHEFAPGRGSLVARLKGAGTDPPLCLLSHIDVVPWEDAGWADDKGPPLRDRGRRRDSVGARCARHEGHGCHRAAYDGLAQAARRTP